MEKISLERNELYQAAISSHDHYDNLSIAIVTGMIAITGAAFTIDAPDSFPFGNALVLFPTAVVVLLLLRIYDKCARSALIARNLSAKLEVGDFPYGFSYVSVNSEDEQFKELIPTRGAGLGTGSRTVTFLAIFLACALLAGGFFEAYEKHQSKAAIPPNNAESPASKYSRPSGWELGFASAPEYGCWAL